MQKTSTWRKFGWTLLASVVVSGTAVAAGKFPEKNIELVVGYKPGGGYADWAQAIAPFIEKHLPNKVNVVVRNMDGASNVVAANYLHKAKPDGYTIGLYNMIGLAIIQAARKMPYDLNQASWLARVAVDNPVALVNAKGPYNSIQDFKKQSKPQHIVSIRGFADNNFLAGAVTFDKLGVKWKPLNHEGASNAILAVIRGDADILWGSHESFQQYLDNGEIKALLYYGNARSPKLPNTPTPAEIGMPELADNLSTQRMIGAPPGLPADVRAVLEVAIKKAVEDPEFLAVMKKTKKTVDYLDGKESAKIVKSALESFKAYSGLMNELMK